MQAGRPQAQRQELGHPHAGLLEQLPGYVDRYLAGQIKVDPFVTHTLPLEQINHAFELMHAGHSIRSVILF
jgi:Zn-dependent alcohol dehydrogenase